MAPNFDDPLGMLRACHRRMEKQLATLERLQRHVPEHGCDDDARAAARAVMRYFDTAAVQHHADEENSLFPRLVATRDSAAALVAQLHAEHATLTLQWAHLRPLLAGIATGERANLSAHDVAVFRGTYDGHMGREEAELLPMAEEILDATTLAAIGAEMAARRRPVGASATPAEGRSRAG
ncbi:MAG: hemerythrin domain-containing protein [Casimicrobiaceae bacterium]